MDFDPPKPDLIFSENSRMEETGYGVPEIHTLIVHY